MSVHNAQEEISEAVLKWEGVTAHPHRFGGTEYRLGKREIGHVHGNSLVDIPFPTKVRHEVVDTGLAKPHHILPDTGWVSIFIRETADISHAIALLRRSFDIASEQKRKKKS